MDLEPLYLYILSLLPVRELSIFELWRSKAGSFEKVYLSDSEALRIIGWNEKLMSAWPEIKRLNSLEKLAKSIQDSGVQTLPYYKVRYPKLLKQIFDAPPVLFYRGKFLTNEENCISIVGSRLISSYGRIALPRITDALINANCTIVSGLAYGTDAAAHEQAVQKNKRTIAVLGSGIDPESIYPRTNYKLSEQILEANGLLVSEHPPGAPAFKQHFVARNRIIAGMSLGTCIIECKSKSGALITADYAMDFNRPVYAVPGPINSPLSEGPNNLIKSGAIPVTSGEDILADLHISFNKQDSKKLQLTPKQTRVLECIKSAAVTIDFLSSVTGLTPQAIIPELTSLELMGLIRNAGPEGYIRQ